MAKRSETIIIYTTFPDRKTANRIIGGLLKARIVACGNIFGIRSSYWWRGKIEKAYEIGAFLKTKNALYRKVETYIKKNHPYEVPAIVVLNVEKGLSKYLKWIDDVTI